MELKRNSKRPTNIKTKRYSLSKVNNTITVICPFFFSLSDASFASQVTQAAEFQIPESKRNYSADFLIVHSATGLGIVSAKCG